MTETTLTEEPPGRGTDTRASTQLRGAPAPRTLLDVFAATVARCPDRLALDAPDARLTYAELSDAAHELASRLNQYGIGRGDRVAVQVPSGTAELYLTILGVLISGAAYVPIDADDPPARAHDLITRSQAVATVGAGQAIKFLIDPRARLDVAGAPSLDDGAWVIFTSGSTGAPKGVAVTHRSAAAFVDAEARLWTVDSTDRVLAGLSVGFDASCEEIWLAWRHGATLVPAPREIVRAGADLGTWLVQRGITVISTVPTLATLWDEETLAGVRLLILGGEACPEALGWRLAAGREVWNTYGPTEATVVTTVAPILPGRPITIGWPLDGWEVAVLLNDVPVGLGETGELVIGGVGLARYLDGDLDRARFAPVPALGWDRAYRTGDMVRATLEGLEFCGRRDAQVKLGGRRIELGEIEAMMAQAPGVKAAAAAVKESAAGSRLLVGYIVGEADPAAVRAFAAERLPAGIVPIIFTLDELPLSGAGKLDRNGLPWPVTAPDGATAAATAGLSESEAWAAERWTDQLGPIPIGSETDFFSSGGASLAAAKLISVVRTRYPAVAVADLYEHRTLGAFAARLDQLGSADAARATVAAGPTDSARRRLGAMQLAGVLVILTVASVPWLLGTLAYGNLVTFGTPHVSWLWLIGAWLLLASPPAHVAMQVIANRVLLRNLRPGRYSRYSWLACRLWFVDRLAEVTRFERLGGTPWADRYARLVGADVGEHARLATVPPAGALLHIGAGATIESNVDLRGWWIDGHELVVGEIIVGSGARVGSRSLLNPGTVIGEGAEIEPGSVVFGEVPSGEHWGGGPARRLGLAGESWPVGPPPLNPRARLFRRLFALSLVFEGALALLALAPAIALIALIGESAPGLHSAFGMMVVEGVIVIVVSVPMTALLTALTLRVVWRLVRPGWHAEQDVVGWALWFGEELKQSASTVLFPLYASLYTRPWFRLMGLEVGRRTEISVTTGLNPLVTFGELSQCTDDIGFCGVRARGGWLELAPISIGRRSFLGPGAVLRGDTHIGDDSLVGVLTLAPRTPPPGTSWFGVPAIELPRTPDAADPARTIDPPRRLIASRGAMDLLRLFGPNFVALLIEILQILGLAALCAHFGLAVAILCAPLVMLAGGIGATAVTVVLKWTIIGRYRRSEHPLWSNFVWRDELINAAQEQLADEHLLRFAIGTPVMSMYMRAMGSRIGRGVWCETTAVTEYDMIDLGDGCAVNRQACLMTHLFQDRLLRIGPTRLEAGATLGPTAVVLPDTTVGAGTTVCGHSVVLRGEELPAGTRWHGAPVVAA